MPENRYQILIVDDETAIRSLVSRYFEKHGTTVHCAGSGDEMHQQLQTFPIDLVFLDVHLPGKDGFALLDEIRRQYLHTAVIMLTARCELSDRLAGLNGGADDYVPKPFEMSELLARAHAVLRRSGRDKPAAGPETCCYHFAGYRLDCRLRALHNVQGDTVELSPAETDLLLVFVHHPQTVLSRDYLLQQTRGRDAAPYDRTIDVRVGQLRKKLPTAEDKVLFKTIRGGGYMLTADVTRSAG